MRRPPEEIAPPRQSRYDPRRALGLWLLLTLFVPTTGAMASDPGDSGANAPVRSSAPPAALARPPAPPPADFKLAVAFHGVAREPITTAELVFRGGIAYLFASESPEEIVIFDPSAARLEFLDLDRRVQAELMLTRLDEKQEALYKAIAAAIRKHDEDGGRANRLAAEMSRSLIAPALSETYDPATHRVRLTNPTVTVDATGEPEPDPARLTLIDATLTALIKLASVRDPKAIPPYARLDALHALTVGHHLRPAELAFVYRLAGPPRKHRWTYRLVNGLTARENEALDRVIRLRERTPYTPFERYEKHEAKPRETGKAEKTEKE